MPFPFFGINMFGILKLFWVLSKAFSDLLNIDRNALKSIPDPTKYLAMILLSCFWCLAFGIYFGELFTIGYNMAGHVLVVTMVFVTWLTFRHFRIIGPVRLHIEFLRAPDRSSRCDEYTTEERQALAARA